MARPFVNHYELAIVVKKKAEEQKQRGSLPADLIIEIQGRKRPWQYVHMYVCTPSVCECNYVHLSKPLWVWPRRDYCELKIVWGQIGDTKKWLHKIFTEARPRLPKDLLKDITSFNPRNLKPTRKIPDYIDTEINHCDDWKRMYRNRQTMDRQQQLLLDLYDLQLEVDSLMRRRQQPHVEWKQPLD